MSLPVKGILSVGTTKLEGGDKSESDGGVGNKGIPGEKLVRPDSCCI